MLLARFGRGLGESAVTGAAHGRDSVQKSFGWFDSCSNGTSIFVVAAWSRESALLHIVQVREPLDRRIESNSGFLLDRLNRSEVMSSLPKLFGMGIVLVHTKPDVLILES